MKKMLLTYSSIIFIINTVEKVKLSEKIKSHNRCDNVKPTVAYFDIPVYTYSYVYLSDYYFWEGMHFV